MKQNWLKYAIAAALAQGALSAQAMTTSEPLGLRETGQGIEASLFQPRWIGYRAMIDPDTWADPRDVTEAIQIAGGSKLKSRGF